MKAGSAKEGDIALHATPHSRSQFIHISSGHEALGALFPRYSLIAGLLQCLYMKHKHKHLNDLSQARRRMRLTRYQVARLIRKTRSTVQRYEAGTLLPRLLTALQFEILYRTPVAFLFPMIYGDLRTRLRAEEEALDEIRKAAHLAKPGRPR